LAPPKQEDSASGFKLGLRGNAAWEAAPAAGSAGRAATLPLAALERGYGMLSYIGRWTGQIEERVAQLSF
jgi:hypothetical protein